MSQNAFQLGVSPYNAVPEKWGKVLLKNLRLVGVYKHIGIDHSSELADNADALNLRIVDGSNIVVGNYYTRSTDTAVAGTEGTINYAPARVNLHKLELTETPYAAVSFEDYALDRADVPFQAALIEDARYQISRYLDTLFMNAAIGAAGTTLPAFNASTAAEGEVYDLLLQISAALKKAGAVPLSNTSDLFGDKGMNKVGYVVVNPDVMRFILREPAFVKVDFNDKRAMWKDGIVRGTIAGLVVLESSNMPTTTGTVTIFAGIKDAMHYAIRLISSRFVPAENKFQILWSTLFAAGVTVSHPAALVKCTVTVA